MANPVEGSKDHPVQLDPWQKIVNVQWPSAPVVLVEVEGQIDFIVVPSNDIKFTDIAKSGDTLTIRDTVITFGSGSGKVGIGTDKKDQAQRLRTFINTEPKPLSDVTARTGSDEHVSLLWDNTDPPLRLKKTSAAIVLTGETYTPDTPKDAGTILKPSDYAGLAMYDPFGNAGVYIVGTDLLYLIWNEIINIFTGNTWVSRSEYVNRLRRSWLVNFAMTTQGTIYVPSPVGNSYTFISTTEDHIIRQLMTTTQTVKVSAYPPSAEFTVTNDGRMTTHSDVKWKFEKTYTFLDDRPDPGPAGVNAYNLAGETNPFGMFNWRVVTFDKNGEVVS